MQAHIDSGRDAGGRDNRSLVHPTSVFPDDYPREHGPEIGDVLPVRGNRFSLKQARFGQQECAGADRRGDLGGGGGSRDPGDDMVALHYWTVHSAWNYQHIEFRMVGDVKAWRYPQAAPRIQGTNRVTNREHFKRCDTVRRETSFHPRRRRKDFKWPAEIEHFDVVVSKYQRFVSYRPVRFSRLFESLMQES